MNLSEQIHELNLETSSILREIGNNLGITLAQVQLILAVPFNSITMSNLSHNLGIDNSTLTRNLNKLELHGYVQRSRDEFDRRVFKVSLVKKGLLTKEKIESQLGDYSLNYFLL
jgi:MarR family transcriptional regulator, organic hydroperoxide resistance regulator